MHRKRLGTRGSIVSLSWKPQPYSDIRLPLSFDDEDHSEEEYREIIIGHSIRHRLLVVSFTERGDVIRIISARKADREEREDYENAKR